MANSEGNNIRFLLNLIEKQNEKLDHDDNSKEKEEKKDQKEILFGQFEELLSEILELKEKFLSLEANKNEEFNKGFDSAISRVVEMIENTLFTKFNKRI